MVNAKEIFYEGLKLDKDYLPILNNLVDLLLLMRELSIAEKIVKSMIDKDPDSAEAFNALGSIYEKRGDLIKAEEYISKALDLRAKYAPQISPSDQ